MADVNNLPNLQQLTAAFRTQYADYFAPSRNRNPRLSIANKNERVVAEWMEWLEGNDLVLQGDYAERRVGDGTSGVSGYATIGGRLVLAVTVAPEGNVSAPQGSLALRDTGLLYRKATGTGPTGWTEVGGSVTVGNIDLVLADIDLTAMATSALANGALSIGGIPFTVDDATRAGAGSGPVNAAGLRLRAPTSVANTWTVAAQDAPHLYCGLSDIPGFVAGIDTLIVDVHLGTHLFEAGNEAIRAGMWGLSGSPFTGAAARARMVDKGNHAGLQTLRTFDGSNVATTGTDFSSHNAFSMILPPDGRTIVGTGNWSSGWPNFDYFWMHGAGGTQDGAFTSRSMRFAIALLNVSDASPTTTVDIAHLRFRKW